MKTLSRSPRVKLAELRIEGYGSIPSRRSASYGGQALAFPDRPECAACCVYRRVTMNGFRRAILKIIDYHNFGLLLLKKGDHNESI